MHEGGGRWVGSNKLVELKKKIKHMELKLPMGPASRENQEALQYKEITAYTR